MIMHDKMLVISVSYIFLSVFVQCDLNLLAQCAVQLLNVSNLTRITVYVTMSSEVTYDFRTELLHSIHRSNNPTTLLNAFSIKLFNPFRKVRPHAYVVVARGVSDLVDHLDAINVTEESWRPEVNFIVILETAVADISKNVLKPVFHRFWINYIFQSVLLVTSVTAGNNSAKAFVWYPFQKKCGMDHTPKTIGTCTRRDDCNHGRWNVRDIMFNKRIPDVFNNCTVKIAGFHWPPSTLLSNETPRTMLGGIDVEIVKLMSRIGNVKLELNEIENDERWGVKFENGTWNGGLGYLSRQKADIMIGNGIMTPERISMFDYSPSRDVIRFQLYTPLPKKLPYWQNMLNVFSTNFWFTLFSVFLLTSALFWLSGVHLPSERRVFADCGYCLIVSWAILCSVPCSGGRQPSSVSSKIMFLSWVIYVLHISAMYTSMQLTYLYKPKYEMPMRTINEVKNSKYSVCCVPTFIPIAHSMSKENFDLTEFTPCTDIMASANRLLKKKDIIILDPEQHFEGLILDYKKKVYKVDEVVILYNTGLYMQKGNPYKRILSKTQIIAYENGLLKKWKQDAISSMPRLLKTEGPVKIKNLNFNDLQGAFIILFCGLFTSLVVFILEFCFSKFI